MEAYTRQRLDQVAEDCAYTRSKIEMIERTLSDFRVQERHQEGRLIRLEKRLFALWVVGPFLVGLTVFFNTVKNIFDGVPK